MVGDTKRDLSVYGVGAAVIIRLIIFLLLLFPSIGMAAPVIFYTDITSGPKTGGENNNGTYLSIFGKGFGTTRGTSTVTINGVEVAAYKCWACTDQYGRSDVQKITVQPGNGVSTGPIVVTVSAQASNNDKIFTIITGDIYFISHSGSDSIGVIGSISQPFRTLSTTYGRSDFGAGDTIVVRGDGTNWTDGTRWLTSGKAGSVGSPLMVIGYPNENVVTVSRSTDVIELGSTASYVTISNIDIVETTSGETCINANDGQTGIRLVNWDCEGAHPSSVGAFNTRMDDSQIYGNTIHNNGVVGNNNSHAIYHRGNNTHIGWNVIRDHAGGRGIQLRSATGASSNSDMHDNIIYNIERSCIIIGEGWGAGIRIFNNIFYNCAQAGQGALQFSSTTPSTNDSQVYNNTFYGNNVGAILLELNLANDPEVRNNIFSETGYYCSGTACSDLIASNNLCYGNGNCPAAWTSSVNANPLFIDPTSPARNFYLQSGSPAINGGTTVLCPAKDHDGMNRDCVTSPDIGAYEYVSTSTFTGAGSDSVSFTENWASVVNGPITGTGSDSVSFTESWGSFLIGPFIVSPTGEVVSLTELWGSAVIGPFSASGSDSVSFTEGWSQVVFGAIAGSGSDSLGLTESWASVVSGPAIYSISQQESLSLTENWGYFSFINVPQMGAGRGGLRGGFE